MSKKVLVTGTPGFIGSELVPALQMEGFETHTFDGAANPKLELLDFDSISRAASAQPWDVVIHLAGVSSVPRCEKDPMTTFRINFDGTALLLKQIRRHAPRAHFIFTSSAQVYAPPTGEEITRGIILDESRKIAPQNVYAVTKWYAELILRDDAERHGFKSTVLRLFNHTHKSQTTDFFLPHLYQALRTGNPGDEHVVPVGNLDVSRDIGALHDLIRAIVTLAKNPSPSVFETFNVCSGRAKNLKRLAKLLAEQMQIQARFELDPARLRANDPKSICGSHEKLTEATGWKPSIASEEDLLRYFLSD